jgi:hypothetical protein
LRSSTSGGTLFSIAATVTVSALVRWSRAKVNGVEHANLFEQRAAEYSKASSQGAWEGKGGVWAVFDEMRK